MSSGYTLGRRDQQRVIDGSHDNGCRGKVPHPSKHHARGVLAKLRRDRRADARIEIYHCAACGRWHLGHRRRQSPHPALVGVADATPMDVPLALALRPSLTRA